MRTMIDTVTMFALISSPFWIEAAVWVIGKVI